MTRRVDVLIVGAGPAGMSAACEARRHGLEVLVVDEQPAPGGQIWRGIEVAAGSRRAAILGESYREGLDVVRRFRASGAQYEPETQLWQVESGPRAFLKRNGATYSVDAVCLLLATGAQERPVPFPGWTLPGVMPVGAAQILLKTSGQIPEKPVWIAGNGPLPLLYATQLLKAGGRIAGFLSTTPHGGLIAALPRLAAAAVGAPGDLIKGLGWLAALRRQVPYVSSVAEIEAIGKGELERIRYVTATGKEATAEAELLLVHEGIVPTIHPTLALGCRHRWNAEQSSYAPELDSWGQTSEAGIFVAGDGAGIGGVKAACLRGEIAALRIAVRLGMLPDSEAVSRAGPIRGQLEKAMASRPFLDRLYQPRRSIFVPRGETIACRCEEVTVATVRAQVSPGRRPGPNQVKTFTRAGMGPCQGRQCNYTIAHVLADAEGRAVPDLGLYRVRPPFKPVTLGELAALNSADAAQ